MDAGISPQNYFPAQLLQLKRYKAQYNTQYFVYMLGALCYVYLPNIYKLMSWPLQLELGEPATVLEPLEFVSAALCSTYNILWMNDTFKDNWPWS